MKAPTVGKSVDSSVQHTNDDSVLSKRSAAKHGYIEDSYLRFFVKKPARRAPLINRGYYLRIVAMTALVEQCLALFAKHMVPQKQSRLQVLSLGAGFDTLAPRLYLRPEYQNVHFYEVDFPPVIANKTGLVAAAPKGSFPFIADTEIIKPGSTTMTFGRYHSLGLDLRETESRLTKILADQGFDPTAPTVVYAECVMQYMTPDCSDGMVRWTAANLPNAIFMAYDQINPYDSFGGVMQHSLRSKCSPLAGVHNFPDGVALSKRAVRLGLEEVRFANFYDLARYHISKGEKARVDKLEMFDEFEEWAEMCEHYGILCARTRHSSVARLPDHPALVDVLAQHERDKKHLSTLTSASARASEISASASAASHSVATSATDKSLDLQLSASAWPNARLGMGCYGNGTVHVEHIAEAGGSDPIIVAFGGVSISKGTTRTDSVFIHSLRDGDFKVISVGQEAQATSSAAPSARSHHTFTRLSAFQYVAFGGRTNPTCVYNDSYLCEVAPQQGSSVPTSTVRWTRLSVVGDQVPPPRFRHTDVSLQNGNGFIVIGGRGSDGASRLKDVWHATVDADKRSIKWRQVTLDESSCQFPAHCTAAACLVPCKDGLTTANLIVCGGMLDDDVALGTAYRLEFDSTLVFAKVSEPDWAARVGKNVMGRFGHTITILPSEDEKAAPKLLIFGGLGFVPKLRTNHWQPLLICDPLSGPHATVAALLLPEDKSKMSFVRHSVVVLERRKGSIKLGVVGGGFTCFSFGIYSPSPLIITLGAPGIEDNSNTNAGEVTMTAMPGLVPSNTMKEVLSAQFSIEAWAKHHSSPFPVVLRGTPIGPCISEWANPDSLKTGGADLTVAVHVARRTGNILLDFVHKNFDFRHVPFSSLVDHCWHSEEGTSSSSSDAETWYFRSVGANMKNESSNFYRDFSRLAKSFVLPAEVQSTVLNPSTHHQSCFRINQRGMRLWPHYDVMDNILVNVVGSKKVVLFPPTQYANLYMKGSSSPVLDVCAPDLAKYPRALEALKFAQVATLQPGDMLVLPALWVHAITAETACVSVNLFYKRRTMLKPRQVGTSGSGNAPITAYDDPFDKKDLYGNKDLPSLVQAKKTVLDAVRDTLASNDSPYEFKVLMLQQLICELQTTSETLFIQSQQRK